MKNNAVTVILVILILGLSGFLVYDKVLVKDVKKESKEEVKVEEKDEVKEYTYKDLAGNYYFETNANYSEIPELTISFILNLDEKGTFNFVYASMTPDGLLGNYIIEDDKIILNYSFKTGSDSVIYYKTGTFTLTIDDEANLTAMVDDKANGFYLERIKGTKIILKKDSSDKADIGSFNETFKHYAGNDNSLLN